MPVARSTPWSGPAEHVYLRSGLDPSFAQGQAERWRWIDLRGTAAPEQQRRPRRVPRPGGEMRSAPGSGLLRPSQDVPGSARHRWGLVGRHRAGSGTPCARCGRGPDDPVTSVTRTRERPAGAGEGARPSSSLDPRCGRSVLPGGLRPAPWRSRDRARRHRRVNEQHRPGGGRQAPFMSVLPTREETWLVAIAVQALPPEPARIRVASSRPEQDGPVPAVPRSPGARPRPAGPRWPTIVVRPSQRHTRPERPASRRRGARLRGCPAVSGGP